MVPNFCLSVWTSVKVKSKKYFYFTDFLLKWSPCWLMSTSQQNSTTEVTLSNICTSIMQIAKPDTHAALVISFLDALTFSTIVFFFFLEVIQYLFSISKIIDISLTSWKKAVFFHKILWIYHIHKLLNQLISLKKNFAIVWRHNIFWKKLPLIELSSFAPELLSFLRIRLPFVLSFLAERSFSGRVVRKKKDVFLVNNVVSKQ